MIFNKKKKKKKKKKKEERESQLANNRVKLKESKREKYLDLARELKNYGT